MVVAIGGLVWAIGACSDNKTKNDAGGGDSGFVTCHENMLTPGTYPDPTCDPAAIDNSCVAGAGKCTIDAKCGSQDTCLPLSNNAGKSVLDFRMRKLNVVAPQSLAGLQKIVIDKGVLLNTCGDKADGTFSWLLRVDKNAKTLLTGGAPPAADPFTAYCFYRQKVNGIDVQPVTVPITFNGNTFQTGDSALQQLNIPIFILNNPVPVILPVRGAKIAAATIGPDDCIGSFQKDALDSTCIETDPATCPKWRSNAALGGYITLEDADKVNIRETNKTLCAQLTGDVTGGMVDIGGGVMIAHCGRNAGKLTAKGDFCEATKTAGGCQDAFWLAATFAASAAKIDDPGTNPLCAMGASDAGGD